MGTREVVLYVNLLQTRLPYLEVVRGESGGTKAIGTKTEAKKKKKTPTDLDNKR